MLLRKFVFSEGTSDKFWNIVWDGALHTVNYGRQGTAGQTQAKTFASDAEAEASFHKLIAEKVKKGYVEKPIEGAQPPPAEADAPSAPTVNAAPLSAMPKNAKTEPTRTEDECWIDLMSADFVPLAGQARTVKTRPDPRPFSQTQAAACFAALADPIYSYQSLKWTSAKIPAGMTQEEARFWLDAMTAVRLKGSVGSQQIISVTTVAQELAGRDFTRQVSLDEATQKVVGSQPLVSQEVMLPLGLLFPVADLVTLMVTLQPPPSRHGGSMRIPILERLVDGFRDHVLPYLTDEEFKAAGDKLRPAIDPDASPFYVEEEPLLRLAGHLGLHKELRRVVSRWKSRVKMVSSYGHDGQRRLVFLLGDAVTIRTETRRLGLPLIAPDDVRRWLAVTGVSALDWVRDSILNVTRKDEAEALTKAFARVHAPEAAPFMLELMLSSKAPALAREWLESNPAHAVTGLVPVAAGHGRLAESAIDILRRLKRQGQDERLRAELDKQPAAIADRIQATVIDAEDEREKYAPLTDADTPEALRTVFADAASLKPSGVHPTGLSPLLVAGSLNRLSDSQVSLLLAALQHSPLPKPGAALDLAHPLIGAVRAVAAPHSRDAFVWKLFEGWLADGAPGADKWKLMSLGHLGGDAVALKLAPLIRVWPGESQHGRAVLGLEALQAIGTDTALMQINGIAQKAPFKGIKAAAEKAMTSIAQARGLSRPELEDRIVPDCDLDERGSRVFDFGPRRFRMVLGPDMKPRVRDDADRVLPDLPKPNAKDDPAMAADAVGEWKLLKKQVAEAAKIQARRLEQAMVTGRRWTRSEFETLLVRHPLMTNLTRLLVWAAVGGDGSLRGTFRVTEDQTYAGIDDETYTLPKDARVGIVHPLQLTPEDRAAWGEIFGDYELVPPFPQMGRAIHTLEPGEAEATEITRFAGVAIPSPTLVFTLEKQGWARGTPLDAGIFHEHTKHFEAADVTAIVTYPGVPVGYMDGWEDQRIESCYFLPGRYKSDWGSWTAKEKRVALGRVEPVIVSEVLSDLTLIASKGKP